jgi:hypothetical protein
MEKKKTTDRLQLLNSGRAHYLDFLRNLTPQIILFSMAIFVMLKLDFTRFDFNNIAPTFLFFFLFSSFALAFYANSTLFYDRCFSELKEWATELNKSMTENNINGYHRFSATIKAVWKERFIEYIEVIAVLFFFQIALAVVIVMSIYSAVNLWQFTHHAA